MAKASKSTWAVLVAIVAVVATIAAVVLLTGGEATAKQFASLQILEGDVDVAKGGGSFSAAADGQSLTQGDVVRTGPDGLAEITYFDESLTRLGPDTEFTLQELATLDNDAKSKRIQGAHGRGRTWNRVTKLADTQSRFEIETPVATAAVRGTVFATMCDFFGDCTYISIEDAIEVCDADECVTLNAFDVVVVSSDGTFGDVVHFDSLADLIAAFPWVNDNACDIEDLLDCGEEPDEPDPDPTPTESPSPIPTSTETAPPVDDGEPAVDGPTPAPAPAANSAPNAAFSPSDSSGGAPLSVAFDNQSSDPDGDALTYVWDFGDGSSLSTAAEPSHTFSVGTWTVSLTARDGDGATDTVSHLIASSDATAPAAPTFTSPAPGSVVTESPVTFTGDAEEGSTVTVFDGGVPIGSDVANSPFSVTAPLGDGVHVITATATDAAGNESAPSTALTITVDAVNDPPEADPDELTTAEDTPASINVLANDADPNGDLLSVASVTEPSHGAVVNLGDGTITYTPDADFSGSDSFAYTASDGGGGTDEATVSVIVTSVNDPPVAADDGAATDEESPVTVDVLANDSDADGDPLFVSSFSQPANGSVSLTEGGELQYTPDADFSGTDVFTYTANDGNGGTDSAVVTVEVAGVNDPPLCGDHSVQTNEDTALQGELVCSDTDGPALAYAVETAPAHGLLDVDPDGSFTYTPAANYHGPDSFQIVATDGASGSAVSTFSVTVVSVNDEPSAANDTATTDEDTPVDIRVLDNDSDPDGDTLSIDAVTVQPANGTATVTADSGGPVIRYTPGEGFSGSDSFTYRVADGNGGTDTAVVNITVNAVDDAGVASLEATPNEGVAPLEVDFTIGGTDADGLVSWSLVFGDESEEVVTVASTGGAWPPPAEVSHTYTDPDTYQAVLTVTDTDGNTATDTETIIVSPPDVNDPPDAVNDSATNVGEPITIDVLVNDDDPDEGDSFSIVSFTQGGSGSVEAGEVAGTLVYSPNEGYTGSDAFTYTIEDEDGLQDTATVSIGATADAVTISLSWPGPVGRDLDLHLLTPSFQELYFGNLCLESGETGCWAALDQDVQQGPPGTETITLRPGLDGYETGTYTVYVDNWSCSEHTFEDTGATVTINTASASQTFSLPSANRSLRQWNVGTVALDAGGAGSPSATGTMEGETCGGVVDLALQGRGHREHGNGRGVGHDRHGDKGSELTAEQRAERRARLEDRQAREDRHNDGGAAPAPADATVTGLRARADADGTVRLDWQGTPGTRALARYGTDRFPRRTNEGLPGCEGADRCDIHGLAPGTRVFVTVFAQGQDRVEPIPSVNAVEIAVPEARVSPAPDLAPAAPPAPSGPDPVPPEAEAPPPPPVPVQEPSVERTGERDRRGGGHAKRR